MIAWVDCSVGAAGDMLLAALIDAGADADRVREGLAGLGLPGWTLAVDEVRRGAFRALQARFVVPDEGHVHRPWRYVRAILQAAALPERVRERALATYGRLAEAEAALHGTPPDDVELHEVGALDAILDVVGVCLALEHLGVDELVAHAIPVGTGQVRGAHGLIPLPAPATLRVLEGWPIVPAPKHGEWVTPTAAALLSALGRPGGPPAMTVRRTGHGAGSRNPPDVPNLVRVVIGEAGRAEAPEQVVELACNLDDQPGQHLPPLIDRLLADGALDAWAAPVHMKKGRPGLVVSVLCRPEDADRLSEVLLRHSTTLGVRRYGAERRVLDRWIDTVSTPYGEVRIKVGGRDGVPWHAAPEHDDVAARAKAADVPVHEVHAAAMAAWRRS